MIRKVGDTVGDLEGDIDILLEHTTNQDARDRAARLRDEIVDGRNVDDSVEWEVAAEIRRQILELAEETEPFLLEDILLRQQRRPLVEDDILPTDDI
ncbi:MAG TPA: hypothetical protein VHA78_01855 [Candidatus Peribacteraceae bacterium]|nr:hypothetical protein [Candidatus Peribacteraceae bacterium]